jgi:hypothetical protein
MRDDGDPHRQEFIVITGVVLVMMRQEHVLNGLVRDTFNQLH